MLFKIQQERESLLFKIQQEREFVIQNPAREREFVIQNPAREREREAAMSKLKDGGDLADLKHSELKLALLARREEVHALKNQLKTTAQRRDQALKLAAFAERLCNEVKREREREKEREKFFFSEC